MTRTITPTRLWFGLLAAPSAWVFQGLAGWFFGARICGQSSIGTVRAAVGAIGALAVAWSLVSLSVSLGTWREVRDAGRSPEDRTGFMAFSGVFVSTAFAVGTFWAALNAIFIDVCGSMR